MSTKKRYQIEKKDRIIAFCAILLLSIVFHLFAYQHYSDHTYPKMIGGRAVRAAAIAYNFLDGYGFTVNADVFWHLEELETGNLSPEEHILRIKNPLYFDNHDVTDAELDSIGLSFVIAAIWEIFHIRNIDIILRVLFSIQVLVPVMVYLLSSRISGKKSGMVSAIFAILFTPMIGYMALIRDHWFTSIAFLISALMITTTWKTPKIETIINAFFGVLLGIFALIRDDGLLFLFVVIIGLFLKYHFSKRALVQVFVILITVFAVRFSGQEFSKSNGFAGSGSHGIWFPILVGTADMGYLEHKDDGYAFAAIRDVDPNAKLGTKKHDEIAKSLVIQAFREDPIAFIAMFPKRAMKVGLSIEHDWSRLSIWPYNLGYRFLRFLIPSIGFIGVLISIIKNWQNKEKLFNSLMIIMIGLLNLAVVVLILEKNPRYYISWTLVYVIFSGVGVIAIIRASKLALLRVNS